MCVTRVPSPGCFGHEHTPYIQKKLGVSLLMISFHAVFREESLLFAFHSFDIFSDGMLRYSTIIKSGA
jgi:hypothetical protein